MNEPQPTASRWAHTALVNDKAIGHYVFGQVKTAIKINVPGVWTGKGGMQGGCDTDATFVVTPPK
jgi:hypothetical protein